MSGEEGEVKGGRKRERERERMLQRVCKGEWNGEGKGENAGGGGWREKKCRMKMYRSQTGLVTMDKWRKQRKE